MCSEEEAARQGHSISAGHDAYVAGRDIVFNVHLPPAPDATDQPDGPGLGERLFTASVGAHPGKLAVAFGAEDTLVVTDNDAAIHRWSLSGRTRLPGAPGGNLPPLRAGTSTQLAVSTTIPAVAVAHGSRCSVVHFSDGGFRTCDVPLGRNEFLVSASAERFATHDSRRMAIRDFTDGTVVWEQPCPRGVAAAAIDARGTTVAMAGTSSRLVPSLAPADRFIVTSRDDPRPREFTFGNVAMPGAGCQLGMAPGGELVACASFREILLARPGTGEDTAQIVRRRRMSGVREEIVPALGTRPHRLICIADGQVLWLRGRRVVDVNWAGSKFRYLAQDGWCDDIGFDHANSRLAMVSESGQVDVFEWRRR